MSIAPTLVQHIQHWARVRPDAFALHGKIDGHWQRVTWKSYWSNVRDVAAAMISLGLKVGDSVAILAPNKMEWVQYEFGIQAARAIPAPIYGNATLEQTAYIIRDSGARMVVVDGEVLLRKVLDAEDKGAIERLEQIFTFSPMQLSADLRAKVEGRLRSFEEMLQLGRTVDRTEAEARLAALDPNDTCILIYTSGTTGAPKGVEISAAGQLVIGRGTQDFAPQFYSGEADYHAISYLPLSHQAEQLLTNVVGLGVGGQVYFCPEITEVRNYLAEVRPTVFLGVPRVWEKFEAALRSRLDGTTGVKGALAKWARQVEFAAFEKQTELGVPTRRYQPATRKLARRLVINKVKQALGLERLEIALTGSAPMGPETQRFFATLGITVFEVYGMTENSGAVTISDPLRPRFGTVGKPFRGVRLRIGEEGEIQVHGPNNVRGYRGMEAPDLYTADGWLRTGDQGSLDAEGNLRITGRLKELLITSGGKNVAPIEIEFLLQSIPGVGQAMVVGDGKPFLSALLTLDAEYAAEFGRQLNLAGKSRDELAASDAVRKHLEQQIESHCNSKLARYQTIKKIRILPGEFTVDGGELTPSMKFRRKPITEKYAREIESMYADGTLATPAG